MRFGRVPVIGQAERCADCIQLQIFELDEG